MIAQSYGLKTMSAVDWILAIWAVLACLAWCLTYFKALYHFLSIPLLKQFTHKEPQYWPKLSVVIPARNEADMLEQAVTTLLTQDYPNLELILINLLRNPQREHNQRLLLASEKELKLSVNAKRYCPLVECGCNLM